MAKGMRLTTARAREAIRTRTRTYFNLHSEYIPKSIRSTPHTQTQIKATARGFKSYGDIQGAVYLRPGSGARSLSFLVPHETGDYKTADGMVAVPAMDLDNYQHKTSRGKTAKRWKPATLLKQFNQQQGKVGGNIRGTTQVRSGQKIAFLKKSPKSGLVQVVRRRTRKSKDLQYLYTLISAPKMPGNWGFERTVRRNVIQNYRSNFTYVMNKIFK